MILQSRFPRSKCNKFHISDICRRPFSIGQLPFSPPPRRLYIQCTVCTHWEQCYCCFDKFIVNQDDCFQDFLTTVQYLHSTVAKGVCSTIQCVHLFSTCKFGLLSHFYTSCIMVIIEFETLQHLDEKEGTKSAAAARQSTP